MTQVLLHVDSSPRAGGATRTLTEAFVGAWRDINPDGEVRHHDLPMLNLPHLNATEMGAWFDDPADYTNLHALVLARSDLLIEDVLEADELIIGAPMWNFSIPSSLKAWIDHVCRTGRTLQPGEQGLVGIVPARRAVVVTASGADYTSESPIAGLNMVGSYMTQILGFMGVDAIEVVHAHRQGPHWPDAADELERARDEVLALAGQPIDLRADARTASVDVPV